ncbi:MAG: hypothetical protein E6R03_11930 [Hyphomicrobiaceae bacterium]|nr:MAG: hypothetical protein E6R03_11930 [Hyphomicrobiaceae bacterium]
MNFEKYRKHFERHVVTQELDNGLFRSWKCANPGNSLYWFRVVTWPGCLYIGGDFEDFVFCREPDMVKWAKMAIKDPRHMAEKVVAGNPWEFSEERLRSWLEEYAKECRPGSSIRNAIECLLENEVITIEDAEIGIDDVPDCEVLTEQYLATSAALSWLLERI